jgi:hypothetical protein
MIVVVIHNKRTVQAVNVVVGGFLIGSTILGLQYYAYIQYCLGRVWCDKTVPFNFRVCPKRILGRGCPEILDAQ